MTEPSPRVSARGYLAWLFAAVGLGTIAWLVHRAGVDRLRMAVAALLPWVPVLAALEGARWLVDAWTTWLLYGARSSGAKPGRLVAATLGAYPVVLLLPAGRLGGEILKAAAMQRDVGMPRAAAAAVRMQALPLLAGALASVPLAGVALWIWGPTMLSGAIALQMATAIALGATILWGSRRPAVGAILRRVSQRLGTTADEVQAELRAEPALPLAAFAAAFVGRTLLVVQLLLVAQAIGVPRGVQGGLLTAGLHLVGLAAGDLIPAQLGATDAALVLGADALDVDASSLVAATLTLHAVQLAWAALGAVAWLAFGRPRRSMPQRL